MPESDLSLLTWMREGITDDWAKGMLYRQAAIEQMMFFRDRIATALFAPDEMEERAVFCKIAGWHVSKSIHLPVYSLSTGAVEIVARNNFHNWNVTVISARDIDLPNYFDIDGSANYLFLEGMEVYRRGPYRDNHREFSFCVWNNYSLYAILLCIAAQTRSLTPLSPVAVR